MERESRAEPSERFTIVLIACDEILISSALATSVNKFSICFAFNLENSKHWHLESIVAGIL